jgi:hypothetical protein
MESAEAANQQMQLRTIATIPIIKQVFPTAFLSISWSFIQTIPKMMPTTGMKNDKMYKSAF